MSERLERCVGGGRHSWTGRGSSYRCETCGRYYWALVDEARARRKPTAGDCTCDIYARLAEIEKQAAASPADSSDLRVPGRLKVEGSIGSTLIAGTNYRVAEIREHHEPTGEGEPPNITTVLTFVPVIADSSDLDVLTFARFSETNRGRCESPDGFGHPLSGWTRSDWITAAVGEFGEAANVAKKLNRVRDGIPGNDKTEDELRQMLADEYADAVIYLDLAAQADGIDLGTAVASKFDRTSEKIGAPHRLLTVSDGEE